MTNIPLFPLKTVLLPGNTLSLKIFEARYMDMIANCLRENSAFGVILILDGEETQPDSDICSIGTTAIVSDWQDRADGLLGITATGVERFRVISTNTLTDGLIVAEIDLLNEDNLGQIPDQYSYMQELLNHITTQEGKTNQLPQNFPTILYQLVYLLPLDVNLKQRLLEIQNCNDRAVILHAELIRLGIIQYIKPEDQ